MGRNRRPACPFHDSHRHSTRLVHRYVNRHQQRLKENDHSYYNTSSRLGQLANRDSEITVCYTLGIYLLNIFLAFLQPKIDPSLTQDEGLEDGSTNEPTLPTKESEEFRPFIRRLPEFKFWHQATRATAIAFVCTWFRIFDVPVFWPVLVMYFIILFSLTSEYPSAPRYSSPCWVERGAADSTLICC